MVLLCAALSIDALSIGASCGFGGIRMSPVSRGIVMLVSVCVTGAAVCTGYLMSGFVTELIGRLVGSLLLMLIGGYMIMGAFRKKRQPERAEGVLALSARMIGTPEDCDLDHSKTIDYKEACIIGLALSADSFAAGISAGIGGVEAFWVPVLCGLFQTALLWCGESSARRLRRVLPLGQRIFPTAAGVILIAVALYRLCS